ncbi:hypothetical protein [Sediminimonas qiaohouensis]|uniref:hypothetical protein n=1 Tax=Sediminimonas qiaohouensis TaxID=552061 RepID=UPI0012EE2F45|nr:hypothetical protein [Sediminimonas qiaohouensis]
MSTWTSDAPRQGWSWGTRCGAVRIAALCLILVAVAGCLSLGSEKPAPAIRQAQLVNGAVIVPAPVGYCIEPSSIEDEGRDAFILIGRCDLLTGQEAGLPVAPAIMTVSVSGTDAPEGQPKGDELVQSLGAERVLSRIEEPNLSLFQVESAKRLTRSGDSRHWRGIMTVNGHIVGLAAYGARDSNVSGEGGEALIRALARRIRDASPEQPPADDALAPPTNSADNPPVPASEQESAETGGLKKLIGRLFN